MTLYTEMVQAGIKTNHYESDLHVPNTPESRAILANHGKKIDGWNVVLFRSNIDGKAWLDIPFAFDPAWVRK